MGMSSYFPGPPQTSHHPDRDVFPQHETQVSFSTLPPRATNSVTSKTPSFKHELNPVDDSDLLSFPLTLLYLIRMCSDHQGKVEFIVEFLLRATTRATNNGNVELLPRA